jgi:penicillin G amidase
MRIVKFLISLLFTLGLIYALSIQHAIGTSKTPPLGKFLNPFVGFWQNAEPKNPQIEATMVLKDLKEEASVVYDDRMVPHIFAKNLEDAYYLQGYVTAKQRLWQMEFQTLATEGRLSEIINSEKVLELDKNQRRRGLAYGAEKSHEVWKTHESFKYTQAYTDGVNAYIQSLAAKDLPFEYKLLNYKPEPWTTYKCALFLKSMVNVLARHDDDLEAQNAFKLLGEEMFNYLHPEQYATDDPIIPATVKYDFEPKWIKTDTAVDNDKKQDVSYLPIEKPYEGLGSNNWAVAGSKTLSGNPILCGDPHLKLSLPSIWFEIQISTPEMNTYGVSLPGIQGVIIGFNEHIAWSQTNVGRDVMDWYTIEWKDASKMEYKYGNGYRKVDLRIEKIKVRGGQTVLDTVRYTHYGPIVYEAKDHPQKDMALRWQAHLGPTYDEQMVFTKLNAAKNYEEYVEALKYYECPAQNFVFACRDGDIALWTQGNFPMKAKGQGRFVMDGSNPSNEWKGFIPKEHNPHVRNPERGFVSSANQISTAPDYPYYYTGGFSEYRGRVLNRELQQMDKITIKDMMALQFNNESLLAEEALPVMLANVDTSKLTNIEKSYYLKLLNWDKIFTKESKIAPLFIEWYDGLYKITWDEFSALHQPILKPETRRFIEIMKDKKELAYYDIQATKNKVETLKDITTKSFRDAVFNLKVLKDKSKDKQDVRWGVYKQTVIEHLAKLPQLSVPVDIAGHKHSLNANSEEHGPSWRMVVDLGKEVKAYGVYPGGQSGNPGSRFYGQFIDKWSKGEYYDLLFMKKKEEKTDRILAVQTFKNK